MLSEEKQKQLLIRFKAETTRQLALLRSSLPRLEQAPDDTDLLRAMFIASHNIKSNLGTMRQFDERLLKLVGIARKLESTLMGLEKGLIAVEPEIFSVIDHNIRQIELEFS